MARVASLSMHKNKVEARRKKALAAAAKGRVEACIRENDIRAYAFVGIDAQGKLHAAYDTGAILPLWAFPSVIADGLRRSIEDGNIVEDWVPALTLKGGSD